MTNSWDDDRVLTDSSDFWMCSLTISVRLYLMAVKNGTAHQQCMKLPYWKCFTRTSTIIVPLMIMRGLYLFSVVHCSPKMEKEVTDFARVEKGRNRYKLTLG